MDDQAEFATAYALQSQEDSDRRGQRGRAVWGSDTSPEGDARPLQHGGEARHRTQALPRSGLGRPHSHADGPADESDNDSIDSETEGSDCVSSCHSPRYHQRALAREAILRQAARADGHAHATQLSRQPSLCQMNAAAVAAAAAEHLPHEHTLAAGTAGAAPAVVRPDACASVALAHGQGKAVPSKCAGCSSGDDEEEGGQQQTPPGPCGAGPGVEWEDEGLPGGEQDELKGDSSSTEFNLNDMKLEKRRPWYKRSGFWLPALSWTISCCFLTAGAVTVSLFPDAKLLHFDVWRWCFFLSLWPLIYWASRLTMWALTCFLEWRFFTARTALFFLVGTRGAFMDVMRSSLVLGAYAALFQSQPDKGESAVATAFDIILRVLGCLVLFTVANMLTKIAMKLLSTHFHKEVHFRQMQEALKKEYYLQAMCQPRDPHTAPYRDSTASVAHLGPALAAAQQHRSLVDRIFSRSRTLVKSLSRSASRRQQRTQDDPLLVDRSLRSDAGLPPAPAAQNPGFVAAAGQASLGGSPLGVSVELPPPSPAVPLAQPQAIPAIRGMRRSTMGLPSSPPSFHSTHTVAARMHSLKFRPDSRQASLHSLHSQAPKGPAQIHDLLELGACTQPAAVGAGGAERKARVARRLGGRIDMETVQKLQMLERHIRKNKLRLNFTDQIADMRTTSCGEEGEVSSKQEAKQLAFFLLHNVKRSRKRQHLVLADLYDFLPRDQAAEAFKFLDYNGDGSVSLSELKEAVVHIYEQRKHLALTLRDTKSVIGKLERLIGGGIHVLFIFFYLAIFNVDVTKAWLTFSSIVLAFTFVFGNSLRNVFEAAMFLFGTHAFDVGDLLLLNGENHKVEEISLLTTVLVRWDGARIWVPNSRLAADALVNLSRSSNKGESVKVAVDMATPTSVVEALTKAVERHVKQQPREFTGAASVSVRGMADPMKLTLSVWYELNHNGVDAGRAAVARSGLYLTIASVLSEMGVQFSLPSIPAHGSGGQQRAPLPHVMDSLPAEFAAAACLQGSAFGIQRDL